jgi:glycosyltransferase involved in cell wall biosynthesis
MPRGSSAGAERGGLVLTGENDARRPAVSVIVPAYNASRTIERCVGALAQQDGTHLFEVIVVHSGTDDTCQRARSVDARVRAVQLAERAIPPRARNLGIRLARGDVFALVDSDVYVLPGWLDRVVEVSGLGHDLVCGSILNANPHSAVSRAEQILMFNEFLPGGPRRPSWFALSGNTVIGRAAYERFGPFVEVRAAEDVVFSRRLIAMGGTILFEPGLAVLHDNRTRLGPFLRNQVLLGTHTAAARRLVTFADSSYWLFLVALPVAPVLKLGRILVRLGRQGRGELRHALRQLPLLGLGVLAYWIGMGRAILGRAPGPGSLRSGRVPEPERPEPRGGEAATADRPRAERAGSARQK